MKQLILLLLITTSSFAAHAAEALPGYIVLASHDTVQCKIKGGKFLTSPFQRITIINEHGQDETLPSKGKKIIAFGFIENMRRYDYLFLDTGDRLETGFFQLLVDGSRYKLYVHPTTIYGGNSTYVLFTPTGEFAKFEPCVVCPWKKQLRELLRADAAALAEVDNASRINVPKFVLEINKP